MIEDAVGDLSFYMPTRVVFGPGTLARLPDLVEEEAGPDASVFLVTGRHSLRASGVLDKVLSGLGRFRVAHFDRTLPFPSPRLAEEALEACRSAAPDVIVGVGGGSALDLSKVVATLMTNPGLSLEPPIDSSQIDRPLLPFIAVPTTSGSSSEVTSAAALWDVDGKQAHAVVSPMTFPTVALVDPDLAMTMPAALAAATGIDAFTSAFESYWSINANPLTDSLALTAIRIYAQNLEASCQRGERAARINCSLAATVAGTGYTNCWPNICHGFSRALTLFWNVEHGQAVGVSLPECLGWNAEAVSHKLPALWDALGVRGLEAAQGRLTQILAACGLETRLGPLGVGSDDLDRILDHVQWEQMDVLPKPMAREDARGILESILT